MSVCIITSSQRLQNFAIQMSFQWISAEKKTALFIHKVAESSCICIMSPAEAPSNNFMSKTGETQLEMVILSIYSNFLMFIILYNFFL